MSQLTGSERTLYVRRMFGRIAGRYDLLNRVMTLGQDLRWRREVVRRLPLAGTSGPAPRVLDIGAGTGDLIFTVRDQYPKARPFACDLTPEMVRIGQKRPGGDQIHWVIADATHLPFASQAFAGAVSGYLLRNVPDLPAALAEQERVLAPGAGFAALDTTPPRQNLLRPFIQFYLLKVIPFLGKIIAGDADAYTYLPETTRGFLSAEQLAAQIEQAGFERVGFVRRMFGTMAIHFASAASAKPAPNKTL
jgi:demethylmenaquinone methyltransferase / 2-methoxy-6-polyprenyl-1,4-benzoquinol methylase